MVDEFCSFYVYFLAGYLFAPQLFKIADWASQHVNLALAGLLGWFMVNLASVSSGAADLPVVSLALGGAGAVAIVVAASLLVKVPLGTALNYLGARSIVVYLAFFIPMVVLRLVMVKFIPWLDSGTAAALGTGLAVIAHFGR